MVASLPRRLASAATVFVQGRIVSRHARETGQSRETIYCDARNVSRELEEGPPLRQELERRMQELEAESVPRTLHARGAVEHTTGGASQT